MKRDANEELAKLWHDESQQPLTYNHYYTDNIQKARNEVARKVLKKAMDETTSRDYNGRVHISNNSIDIQTFLTSLQNRTVVNMDEQACSEAKASLLAYYKVKLLSTAVERVGKSGTDRRIGCAQNVCGQSLSPSGRTASPSPITECIFTGKSGRLFG